jgi:septum formation inhibitor-activating ATPase MinD
VFNINGIDLYFGQENRKAFKMTEFAVKKCVYEEAIFNSYVLNALLILAKNEAKEKDFTYLYEILICFEGEDIVYNRRTIYFKFQK